MELPSAPLGQGRVLLAEHQTAGRGRMQNDWLSAPSAGICLSLGFSFTRRPKGLPALTLALGVGAVRALNARGIAGISIKWPNDIVLNDNKLGGILCEVQGAGKGHAAVVAGIGLNVILPDSVKTAVVSDWAGDPADLSALPAETRDRNLLVAALIEEWVSCMVAFEEQGLAPFLPSWRALDWLKGRQVVVELAGQSLSGVADGINDDGELLLLEGDKRHRISSGHVRLCTS